MFISSKERLIALFLVAALLSTGCLFHSSSSPAEADVSGGCAPERELGTRWNLENVVINEILPKPNTDWDGSGSSDDAGDEWIELYNKGTSEVDISYCKLDDITGTGSPEYVIPENTRIGPRETMIFFGSDTSVSLDNGADTVNFIDWTGNVIDTHPYEGSSSDVSIARIPDGEDNWESVASPTPDRRNVAELLNRDIDLVRTSDYVDYAKYLIDTAHLYVYVMNRDMAYYAGNPTSDVSKLYTALDRAQARGVIVRVLMDDNNGSGEDAFDYLTNEGISTIMDNETTNIYSNFIVSDDRVLLGSSVWNESSLKRSIEVNVRANFTDLGFYLQDCFEELYVDPEPTPKARIPVIDKVTPVLDDKYLTKAKTLIQGAEDRIELMMYHIGSGGGALDLLGEIVDAYDRGVQVRVLLESGNHSGPVSADNLAALGVLEEGGVPVVLDGPDELLHANVIRIDSTVLLGSSSWDASSFSGSHTTNLIVRDGVFANSTGAEFDSVWDLMGPTDGSVSVTGGEGPDGEEYYKGGEAVAVVRDRDPNRNPSEREEISVKVSSDSHKSGITVTLTETGINTALFRGTFVLGARTSASDDEIKVIAGDNVTITYRDPMDFNGTVSDFSTSFPVLGVDGTMMLLYPPDGAVFLRDECMLEWDLDYPGIGEMQYRVLVDTVPDPLRVEVPSMNLNLYHLRGLADGNTYYWRVVPMVDGSVRGWPSEVRSFKVEFPGAINLVSPDNGTETNRTEVLLRWEALYDGNGEVSFDLLLGTDPEPNATIASNISGTSYTVKGLEDGKTYYWMIIPIIDGEVRNWSSEVRAFSIEFRGAITLMSPANLGTQSNSTVVLEWAAEYEGKQALRFRVMWDVVPIVNSERSSDISGTSYAIPKVDDDTTYWWKIVPVVNGTVRNWHSPIWSFYVEYSGRITVKNPGNGDVVDSNTTTLKWDNDYLGVKNLRFRVLFDKVPEPNRVAAGSISDGELEMAELENGKTYYWKVIPLIDGEKREWGNPVYSFSVALSEEDDDNGGGGGGEGPKSGITGTVLIIFIAVLVVGLVAVIILVIIKGRGKNEPHHVSEAGASAGVGMPTPVQPPLDQGAPTPYSQPLHSQGWQHQPLQYGAPLQHQPPSSAGTTAHQPPRAQYHEAIAAQQALQTQDQPIPVQQDVHPSHAQPPAASGEMPQAPAQPMPAQQGVHPSPTQPPAATGAMPQAPAQPMSVQQGVHPSPTQPLAATGEMPQAPAQPVAVQQGVHPSPTQPPAASGAMPQAPAQPMSAQQGVHPSQGQLPTAADATQQTSAAASPAQHQPAQPTQRPPPYQ